jgi:hypothetical protein
MTSLTRQIALLFGVAASTGAIAQTPRPPLGPSDVSRQFPLGLQQQAPVASDSITVTNLGDSLLQFSSWDGAEWKPFQISSRKTVSISCAKCGNEIPIAFHDGATNRTMNAQTRTSYGLFWDQTHLRWDFAPLAVIMQRGRLP